MIKELLLSSMITTCSLSNSYQFIQLNYSNEIMPYSDEKRMNYIGGFGSSTIIDYKDGFATYYVETYKLELDKDTNLLLFKAHTEFVPGYTAHSLNSKYDSGRRLGQASVSLQLMRYEDDEKKAKGPELHTILVGPTSNNSFVTSATETYTTGVSLSNQGTFKITDDLSLEIDNSTSGKIDFSITSSNTTVVNDPMLNNYNGNENPVNKVWTANVQNVSVVGKNVYILDTYILFKTNKNTITNSNEDAHIINYSASMTCKYNFMGWHNGSTERFNISILAFL